MGLGFEPSSHVRGTVLLSAVRTKISLTELGAATSILKGLSLCPFVVYG